MEKPASSGLGRGRMCEKFHQLLAVGRWFPPGTPVSSTRKLISSSFHRLDMTLAVAETLNPNKPKQTTKTCFQSSLKWRQTSVWSFCWCNRTSSPCGIASCQEITPLLTAGSSWSFIAWTLLCFLLLAFACTVGSFWRRR